MLGGSLGGKWGTENKTCVNEWEESLCLDHLPDVFSKSKQKCRFANAGEGYFGEGEQVLLASPLCYGTGKM